MLCSCTVVNMNYITDMHVQYGHFILHIIMIILLEYMIVLLGAECLNLANYTAMSYITYVAM